MKNTGYDQFFKKAKKNASHEAAKSISIEQLRKSVSHRKIKNKRKFPLVQFGAFIICAIGFVLAVENVDNIDKNNFLRLESALQKIEISFGLAEAQAEASVTPASDSKKADQEVVKSEGASESQLVKNSETDELDKLYKLTERKKELDLKEEELNKKAKEIDAQKIYVEQKLKELEEYRAKISNLLQDRVKTDATKIENLVQIYSNMRPNQAAKVFETMDEDLVIEILAKMKKKTAADVLNLMKAEKAQLFAERYAGYRVPAGVAKTESKSVTDDNKETIKAPESEKP